MASKKLQFHLVKVLALALVTAGATSQSALALNPVQIENQNQGDPGWLIIQPYQATGDEIEGYASAASVSSISGNATISFYVSVDTAQMNSFNIDIYRMGWYGGAGG